MNEKPEAFEVPDRSMEGFREVALLKSEVSEAAGSIMDMNSSGERSATETSLVASMGNARFADMVSNLEDTTTMVVRQELSLLQQFLSDRLWVRVTHPQSIGEVPAGKMIGREEILGEFDIYCVGASQMSNNSQRAGRLVQITAALSQTPAAQRLDWAAYGSQLFEMEGLKDAANRFWKTDEQIKKERYDEMVLQEQARLAAQTGGPGGMGGPAGSMAGPGGSGAASGLPGQPSMAGPQSLRGLPEGQTAHAPEAFGGGGLGGSPSAPGRRPLGPS
jgi:hypothetical protein